MNTKKLTKEQYEKLLPYEKHIISAYKNSFVHMAGSDFIKVADIYKEIYGAGLTRSQMGCNTCRLNALRQLGELYDAYKKSQEETKPKNTEKKKRTKKLDVTKTEE